MSSEATSKTTSIAAPSISKIMQNELSPYAVFRYSVRSDLTRKYYERRIRSFFDFIHFQRDSVDMETRANDFTVAARRNQKWACNQLISFLSFEKERVKERQITAATLRNFVKSLKSFCESAEIDIPWKRITRGLPRGRQAAGDRAPTMEEIRKLMEYPDRRIKSIVLVMISSGIRIGAWDTIQWKHVTPINNNNGEVVASKITVYAGDVEEYYSFITPEAFAALKDWINFRQSYGEKITDDSWLMRDVWQTTNLNYGARWGLATCPKRLKSSGIKRLLNRALWEQGVRQPLREGQRRHEWKAAHGFRKFYKTRAEQIMKPINVEITMGHNIGISASYYKPTKQEVLDDYLKAVNLLTINAEPLILRKQVDELTEKTQNNEYLISAKLREKDDALATLSDQVMKLMSEVWELKNHSQQSYPCA